MRWGRGGVGPGRHCGGWEVAARGRRVGGGGAATSRGGAPVAATPSTGAQWTPQAGVPLWNLPLQPPRRKSRQNESAPESEPRAPIPSTTALHFGPAVGDPKNLEADPIIATATSRDVKFMLSGWRGS